MNKSPEAFRTISEVAEALTVPPHVLRFWETRFTQVKPVKRGGGRRYYRPEDVRLLRGIRALLYDEGMTIKGAQKILRERGIRHVIAIGTLPEPAEVPPAASAPSPTEHATSQADLFPPPAVEGAAALLDEPAPAAEAPAPPPAGRSAGPLDRSALRALLAELEALRAVMLASPGDPPG